MPVSTGPTVSSAHIQAPLVVAGVVAAIYAFGHLSWFVGTPLGQVPVLDARENLAMANQIVTGTLPVEPFYRAPGYALILAALRLMGIAAGGLFPVALMLGAALHAINATLVAATARTWFGSRSGLVAGLLFGLDPVFVHFAVNVTDATPALTCFLAGLATWAGELTETTPFRPRRWAGASVWWALATVIRPNYLLVWITLPLLALVAQGRPRTGESAPARTSSVRLLVGATLAGLMVFAAIGVWQMYRCGTPGFLPAQGAYNLWAANQPGTNGRYYTQKIALPATLAAQNPARAESVLLYRAETGLTPKDLAPVNAYWRQKFATYVTHHPLEWIALLGRKLYALLNDWEQYNNDTPAFHIARSPWLRWNPIGWGLLFVLGVAGWIRLRSEQPSTSCPLALVAIACLGSALLFYVSARFRLPLAALTAVFAGGALGSWTFWRNASPSEIIATGVACLMASFIAFSRFDDVRNPATYVQDHALLARAAETVGDDRLAWTEAESALELQPDHPDALRLAIASYFNLLLAGENPTANEPQWADAAKKWLAGPTPDASDLRAVAAFALWRAGDHDAARKEWRQLGEIPSAIAARLLIQDPTTTADALTASIKTPAEAAEPLVRLAAATLNLPAFPTGQVTDRESLRASASRLLQSPSARNGAPR